MGHQIVKLSGDSSYNLHRKSPGLSNLEHKICVNDADEGALQKALLATKEQHKEPAPLASGEINEEKKNNKVERTPMRRNILTLGRKRTIFE